MMTAMITVILPTQTTVTKSYHMCLCAFCCAVASS